MRELDPRTRFTDRVDDYVRHRPSYPPEVSSFLAEACGLGPRSHVADIGSGTGIWTAQLLESAEIVYAVEPNESMRRAAEKRLGSDDRFHSVAGSAEQTGLPDSSVDLITAAQAFHWFQPAPTRSEFRRILRTGGAVALLWNRRIESGTELRESYEALLRRWGTDYVSVRASWQVEPALVELLGGDAWTRATFPNFQVLDLDGMKGRLLSNSYAPGPGHPDHEPMLEELERLHDRHAVDGRVTMEYRTVVYVGTP